MGHMKALVSAGIGGVVAGLVLGLQSVITHTPLWKDTAEHLALSKLAWFVAITVALFFVLQKHHESLYMGRGVSSMLKIGALVVTTLLVFVVYAVQILNLGVFVKIPAYLLPYVNAWYAIPAAIALYFLALFFVHD